MKFQSTLIAAALALVAGSAGAANLVFNGGFEATRGGLYGHTTADGLAANGNASLWAPNGGAYTDSAAVGWDVTPGSLGLILAEDALTNSGKYGFYGYYGPSQHYGTSYLLYTNGLGVDPNGGNFVGLDGDHYGGVLSQRISGLTAGSKYKLTFFQASDHYQGWGDLQRSQFLVGFGGDSQLAPSMTTTRDPVPWSQVRMIFTAHSTSQLLTFMNGGGGAPPFALLDGVSLVEGVPEPGAWSLAIMGFGLAGAALRRRRARDARAEQA